MVLEVEDGTSVQVQVSNFTIITSLDIVIGPKWHEIASQPYRT